MAPSKYCPKPKAQRNPKKTVGAVNGRGIPMKLAGRVSDNPFPVPKRGKQRLLGGSKRVVKNRGWGKLSMPAHGMRAQIHARPRKSRAALFRRSRRPQMQNCIAS